VLYAGCYAPQDAHNEENTESDAGSYCDLNNLKHAAYQTEMQTKKEIFSHPTYEFPHCNKQDEE
jgi:hypothetical protein